MDKNKKTMSEREMLAKMESLLKKNIEISKEIERTGRRAEKYIRVGNVFGLVKFIILVIALILIFIYVPPFVQKLLEAYQEFWKAVNSLLPTNG